MFTKYKGSPITAKPQRISRYRLVQLMSLLDGLVLARIQHHCGIFFISLSRNRIAILCGDGGTGFDVSNLIYKVVRCNSLFSLDIQDLTLGLSFAPVPAYSLTLLGTILCTRIITTLFSILLVVFSLFRLL